MRMRLLVVILWLVLTASPASAVVGDDVGTSYPGAYDVIYLRANPGGGPCDSSIPTKACASWANDMMKIVIDGIQKTLGINPQGAFATVVNRLNAGVYSGTSGLSSYTPGSLLYAANTTTLSELADVATGNVLLSGGVGAAPFWGKVNLSQHIEGILADANVANDITLDDINQITNRSHAATHQHGGNDEVATATPGANAIPKAGAGGTIDAGWVPTLNQNTTGTAANLSGTPALPNGVTATTQSQADNSTKVATTAYCDAGLATKLSLTGGTLAGPIDLADQHIKSGSDPADTGVMRYSNNEKLCWELATPGTDLCFYIGTDNEFHFDAPVNVGGSGGPLQLTEAAVSDPGSAGKAHIGVNTSHLLQWYGNGGSLRTAAFGTTTGVPIGDDTAYGAGWNGSTNTPTQNAVYDKIEALSSATGNLHACEYVGNVAAGATNYCSLTGYNASESWLTQVLAQSVTVTRFYLRTVGAQPGTGSLVVTLRKNGSDTSIVATVAAGTAGATVISDTAHSVAFSAGDTFSVKLVNNASASSADLSNIMLGW